MTRIHAFEWNDTAAAPRWLRESIVEILGNGTRWGRLYVSVAPIFARFLERAGTTSVLDIASGSGDPCSILIDALEQSGAKPPRFVVSDLFPNEASLRAIAARHPGKIEVVARSVDATSVPSEIDQPARTIISAFHHFTPELAKSILADCVAKKRGVFIIEGFPRRIVRMLAVIPVMALAAFTNPFLCRRQRLLKLVFTLVPIIPLLGLWDAVVSVLRIHSEAELRAMVAPLGGDYTWEYHEVPFAPFGRATVFLGLPNAGAIAQAPAEGAARA